MPTIFLQCGQQKTRLMANQPRLTWISSFTSSSQYGHTGVISVLLMSTMIILLPVVRKVNRLAQLLFTLPIDSPFAISDPRLWDSCRHCAGSYPLLCRPEPATVVRYSPSLPCGIRSFVIYPGSTPTSGSMVDSGRAIQTSRLLVWSRGKELWYPWLSW
jgi:hypothetical protein